MNPDLPSSTPPTKITVRGLRKSFGRKKVLDGVDLDIAKGDSLVIIGGSGTGKSVFLKCLLGLLKPDDGEIAIDGEPMTGADRATRARLRRKMGMLFQGGALFDSLNVWQNVSFALDKRERRTVGRGEAYRVAIEKLGAVGLGPDVANLSPSELSGGMQKRVALARSIAAEPEILLFDEPTTGLDPITADAINKLIVASVKRLGATAISITHDMASARKIANRIAMLYEGKIIWDGLAADIDRSGNPYIEQFVHGRSEGPIQLQIRAL
jgi:phospholipid/cholesterol/gamma-HCH transport system ATP-binding protein